MTDDRYYIAARRVLLDALEDLAEHRDAIIVVGAQAVYLRSRAANVGVADYTTDGDLAVDSDRLTDFPLLEEVMGARFSHSRASTGAEEPGVWTRTVQIDGEAIDIPVDLIVPEGIAPPGGTRGARLGPHGKRAARKAPGLEAAILDNDVLTVQRRLGHPLIDTPPSLHHRGTDCCRPPASGDPLRHGRRPGKAAGHGSRRVFGTHRISLRRPCWL